MEDLVSCGSLHVVVLIPICMVADLLFVWLQILLESSGIMEINLCQVVYWTTELVCLINSSDKQWTEQHNLCMDTVCSYV